MLSLFKQGYNRAAHFIFKRNYLVFNINLYVGLKDCHTDKLYLVCRQLLLLTGEFFFVNFFVCKVVHLLVLSVVFWSADVQSV